MKTEKDSFIPFNIPFIVGKELYNIAQAVITHKKLSGDGEYTRLCQEWLEKSLICKKSLLTHSCTAALEMAAILLDVQAGDEIIMPSYTFVSTANAFVLRGGIPVFVDIRPDTLNIDENKIEAAITEKTKAIVPVHYAGIPCDMDRIMSIAKKYHLFVVEDSAQALLSTYRDQYLGTIGDLGTLSFHETKNIISGEGGALMINNEELIERAEIIWEKGTNRKKFFRGEIDKYTWVDIGSSYLPGELIAAFLHAQLEHADQIITSRRNFFKLYYCLLKPLEQENVIRLPYVDQGPWTHNGHMFYIITKNLKERTELMQYLRVNGVYAVFHYVPLHTSPAGKKFGRFVGEMKITNEMSERILRLPLFFEMSDSDVERISNCVIDFYKKESRPI